MYTLRMLPEPLTQHRRRHLPDGEVYVPQCKTDRSLPHCDGHNMHARQAAWEGWRCEDAAIIDVFPLLLMQPPRLTYRPSSSSSLLSLPSPPLYRIASSRCSRWLACLQMVQMVQMA